MHYITSHRSRNGVVGIATRYGLEGPGIEYWWRQDFPHLSRPAPRPIQPPVQWVPGLSQGGKGGQSVALATHPHPVSRSIEAYSRVKPYLTLLLIHIVLLEKHTSQSFSTTSPLESREPDDTKVK